MKRRLIGTALGLATVGLIAWSGPDRSLTGTLEWGTPNLKSVGALTFGPENILFIGDTHGAAVFAVVAPDSTSESGLPGR